MKIVFAIALSALGLVPGAHAQQNQIGLVRAFGNADAQMVFEQKSMYRADVDLTFVGRHESYRDCATLGISEARPGGPSRDVEVVCRRGKRVLNVSIQGDRAALMRARLSGNGVDYLGGVLKFLVESQRSDAGFLFPLDLGRTTAIPFRPFG